MLQFIIYTRQVTPRIRYALEVVFNTILGVDYVLVSDEEVYRRSVLLKINYSDNPVAADEFRLNFSGFLGENTIKPIPIKVQFDLEIPYFFAVSKTGEIPFDLPALVFYLVTRYEEYLPFEADIHDRFSANKSLAFLNDFLHRPIVDEWALKLRRLLRTKYPTAKLPFPSFCFQPTYDIDYAWAYQNKKWLFWAGLINDIRLGRKEQLKQRINVKWRGAKDPYFFFEAYQERHLSMKPRPKFFFLLGDYAPHDRNIQWDHPEMQQLIKNISKDFEIGIHPSYRSNEQVSILRKECHRLEQTLGHPVEMSRQHYLKMKFPTTYQRLLEVGIEHDYTMGYADQIGFRASIARPYPWYDLSKETKTSLTIHPFQVMDGTLLQYLKIPTEVAFEQCERLLENTKKVGGEFVTLWHNSSFSPLHGWSEEWQMGYWELLMKF